MRRLTVGELAKALEDAPDDATIIVAGDPEGNHYGTLSTQTVNYNEYDKVLVLGMWEGPMSIEKAMPKLDKKIEEDLKKEGKI